MILIYKCFGLNNSILHTHVAVLFCIANVKVLYFLSTFTVFERKLSFWKKKNRITSFVHSFYGKGEGVVALSRKNVLVWLSCWYMAIFIVPLMTVSSSSTLRHKIHNTLLNFKDSWLINEKTSHQVNKVVRIGIQPWVKHQVTMTVADFVQNDIFPDSALKSNNL